VNVSIFNQSFTFAHKLRSCVLALAALSSGARPTQAQQTQNTELTSGTLNLVLTNKNGFVIAADSRMSSVTPFPCGRQSQTHCDDSQKLFRTGPKSALVIAGFAVGGNSSPLDLAIASVLRKKFGVNGLQSDIQVPGIVSGLASELEMALTNIAELAGENNPPPPLWVTLARINEDHIPVLRQFVFTGTWQNEQPPSGGPIRAVVYQHTDSRDVPISHFAPVPVGISCVAEQVLSGHYLTASPVIRSYYQATKDKKLDDMSLESMKALAGSILSETEKFTDLVGGADQIGVFPAADAGQVEFHLPTQLATGAQLLPNILRWEGIECSNQTPPCGTVPVSFSFGMERGAQPYIKYFYSSKFKDIPVSLDSNIFVANDFDKVTFKWTGSRFFMTRNSVANCTLEMPETLMPPTMPELSSCHVVKLAHIGFPPGTVGLLPIQLIDCPRNTEGNCVGPASAVALTPQP
jgi:hypothetical protein